MSFIANRSFVINGAVSSQYVVEHPVFGDSNTGNPVSPGLRHLQVEATNSTAGTAYIAFDRPVVPPSGVGVQGVINTAVMVKTGPLASTPGDFDLAVPSGSGWCALDFDLFYSSRYMSVYFTAAGPVTVAYGYND